MKTLLAALAGFALVGAVGATQVDAQSVRVNINRHGKSVEVNTGRSTRSEEFRKPERVEKQPSGHYITVQKKVWIPGHYITEHKDVWVPGHYDIVKERRVDHCGNVFYVSVKKFHPGHYECREVQTFVPGRYECREERVWVEDDCGCRDGHDGGETGHGGRQGGGHGRGGR
ncbi:MAG: hypothetical protein H6841_03470 [Planctomycetes bacterium]|nr:hypothetical protein [Planctomycetota bacterium]MCB9934179.1 hypothetical protein [Planctomycetota bacterium]